MTAAIAKGFDMVNLQIVTKLTTGRLAAPTRADPQSVFGVSRNEAVAL